MSTELVINDKPIISIIIPAYNASKTIQETIQSVLNQTFLNFELIVIDDGSTDSTLDVISQISDPRVTVFSYPNAGISTARNRGIEKASGDYITFLDADDLWASDKIETQFEALQKNPQAAVAYSWTTIIDKSNNAVRQGSCYEKSGDVYSKILVKNFLDSGSNIMVRKEAIDKIGRFNPSLKHAADWEFYIRLAAEFEFNCVPKFQVFYRVSENTSSCNVIPMEKAALEIIEKAFKQAPSHLQHLKKYSLSAFYIYLTFKTLENPSKRQDAWIALHYLKLALVSDPVLLKQSTPWKAIFMILCVLLLPKRQSKALNTAVKRLYRKAFNPNSLIHLP
jgi:glycosyltransferase involved in cell wall biosynthesis